jgi:hypothetical protein
MRSLCLKNDLSQLIVLVFLLTLALSGCTQGTKTLEPKCVDGVCISDIHVGRVESRDMNLLSIAFDLTDEKGFFNEDVNLNNETTVEIYQGTSGTYLASLNWEQCGLREEIEEESVLVCWLRMDTQMSESLEDTVLIKIERYDFETTLPVQRAKQATRDTDYLGLILVVALVGVGLYLTFWVYKRTRQNTLLSGSQ